MKINFTAQSTQALENRSGIGPFPAQECSSLLRLHVRLCRRACKTEGGNTVFLPNLSQKSSFPMGLLKTFDLSNKPTEASVTELAIVNEIEG